MKEVGMFDENITPIEEMEACFNEVMIENIELKLSISDYKVIVKSLFSENEKLRAKEKIYLEAIDSYKKIFNK